MRHVCVLIILACVSACGGHRPPVVHPPPPPPPVEKPWTPAQLADMQGDLMLWEPKLALRCNSEGIDPRGGIRCWSPDLGEPRGLIAGWAWAPTVTGFRDPADRTLFYQGAKNQGWTHYAIHIGDCGPGEGYHGLGHVTAEDCLDHADRMNTVLRELRAPPYRFITKCMGVSDFDNQKREPGLDKSLCDIIGDDWDNRYEKDCNMAAIAREFPGKPFYVEMPADTLPQPDACTPPGLLPATDGGAWIRSAQQRFPMFQGVLIETFQEGIDVDVARIRDLQRPFWRDAQMVYFESDTFQKFWHNLDPNDARRYNDDVMRRLPFLKGCFSGCSTHAPPSDETGPVVPGAGHDDMIPIGDVSFVGGPNVAEWPQTADITKLELRLSGIHVEFTKRDGEHRWPDQPFGLGGSLQYSMCLAYKVDGSWYASCPVELWYGLDESGGPIQNQNIEGDGIGQILKNWFYDAGRWPYLSTRNPQAGDEIGFLVVQGDPRNNNSVLHERSNIVKFQLPADGSTLTLTWE